MKNQKISMDLEEKAYMALKRDALESKTTMSRIIRQLLAERYKENENRQGTIETAQPPDGMAD